MYHPGYFGKVGMRHFHLTRQQYHCPILNLDKLMSFVSDDVKEQAKKGNSAIVIDTLKLGFAKVLGKGVLTCPLIVKAKFVSQIAEQKIVAAGGKVELVA